MSRYAWFSSPPGGACWILVGAFAAAPHAAAQDFGHATLPTTGGVVGQHDVLVVLQSYSDSQFTKPVSDFWDLMQDGPENITDYFTENSAGLLDLVRPIDQSLGYV